MQKTTYQKPEIRDANDNIIQQGAFGKNTALANATNDGWIDYVANDLEFLYDLAKDEVVPVASLPASGDMKKTYLLTTNGKTYRWDGTAWVEISSSEAVGRAESAASLAEQWATKTDGVVADNEYSAKYYSNVSKDWANKLNATVDGSEYSAKHYAGVAEGWAEDAEDTAEDIADHLSQIDQNTGGVSANSKRIGNIEKLLQGNLYDYQTDNTSAYTKSVPSGAMPYAGLEKLGGKTIVWNQLVDSGTTTVPTISGRKYYTLIDGTASIVTADGTAITIVDDSADMVCDLTLMFGSGNEPSTTADFTAIFGATHYSYNAGTLLSAGVTEVESVGKNLADIASATNGTVAGITYTYNAETGEFTATGTSTGAASCDVTLAKTITVNAGEKITISLQGTGTFGGFYVYVGTVGSYPVFDGTSIISNGRAVTFTFSNKMKITKMLLRLFAGQTPNCTFKLQIERGETATAYSPYMSDTYPIPTAIRNLEGYGWSAGTAYNYVDFERKVFVQAVKSINLGDKTYEKITNGWFRFTQSDLDGHLFNRDDITNTIVCSNLVVSSFGAVYNDTIDHAVCVANGNDSANPLRQLQFRYDGITSASDFKTAMSGIMLYYKSQTPVETDISAYLTDDNLIQVESGGTLTFENQNGTDYQIPVPSEETYMIDLQSAIGG